MYRISWIITKWCCKWEEFVDFSEELQFTIYQILWDIMTFLIALFCVYSIYRDIQGGIMFSVFFLPLRRVAGGAHAQSHGKCVILTVTMFITYAYYYYRDMSKLIAIIAIIAWIIIWLKAPVQTNNHILTIQQEQENRKNTQKILLLYMALVISYFPMNTRMVNAVLLVIIMIAVLILVESYIFEMPNCKTKVGYYLRPYIVQAIWGICISNCHNAVWMASYRWGYQMDIPDELRHKYDNI